MIKCIGLIFAVLLASVPFAMAQELPAGQRMLYLVEASGERHHVADVAFDPTGSDTSYSITWRDEKFEEHFLSMRPFRCFEGSAKYWCRVPYPYDIKRVVTADDLTDLEYDTMFIWKGATEYGINMWNGVYYQMTLEDGRLVGALNEIDMDTLSAPPDEGVLRPIRDQDLEPGEPESHWLPKLVIE
ncbi:MAG: hypothetical protein OXR62_16805 [Ahrensia sp.]|nr:hypothetical protein [Ahrensia sp.]